MQTSREVSRTANPIAQVLRRRGFRLLWLGQATSLLGDQFAMIATPWLVLQLTNDPLVLGVMYALAGIPRAAFLLIGGVMVDRLSPRTVMLASDILRLALVTLIASMVLTGTIQLWMLYGFSLAFGLLSGFFLPASISVVPSVVEPSELQAGNAVYQGTGQLSGLIGPALAGGVIGWFAHANFGNTTGLIGIGLAFSIDALTFIVSILTLWAMQAGRQPRPGTGEPAAQAILAGLRYTWQQPIVRFLFSITAMINLLFLGPLLIGIPVLANTRLTEGAVAFGLIMSAFAGGNLLGAALAGILPKPDGKQLRWFIPTLTVCYGLALIAFGWIHFTWLALVVMLVLATANGYFTITTMTLLQSLTPRAMLGRLMSLLLFASMGLLPISQAICGAVSRWNLSTLFIGAGVLMLFVALWAASRPVFQTYDRLQEESQI